MLLKSIKLKDFRQFNGVQEIQFSVDKQKNVTIIIGQNGAGKTTFAQAFKWCFYGKTILDGILLSQELQDKMYPGDEEYVEVAVELIHNDMEYTIKRRAKYKKNAANQVNSVGQTDFSITYKEKDGNTVPISQMETELKMKEILPEELFEYFFFDGEHVQNMSKEITNQTKSRDIADAVKSLLGLKAEAKALEHLNKGRYSVIGSYIESYNGDADSEIKRLGTEIGDLTERIDEINKKLETINAAINSDEEKIKELDIRIAKNAKGSELAAQRKELEKSLKELELARVDKTSRFLKSFNSYAPRYFATKLMQDSLIELKNADKLDTGIPDVTAATIDFLFSKKKCICGQPLEVGDAHYNALYKLLDSIPPKSLGSLIREFTASCEEKTHAVEMFKDEFEDKFKFLRGYENTKDEKERQLSIISDQLKDVEDVSKLEAERGNFKRNLNTMAQERDELNQEKGVKENNKRLDEQRVHELSAGNQKNAEIELYKTYAMYVHDMLKDYYDKKEKETREELAKSIDEIFKQIYNGGFSLSLDSKYNIEVTPYLQPSTGQSMAIILAFIAGVIKMAKNKNQQDGIFNTTEAYPLVMDAPLSTFDKERTGTVCDVLPKIAEQAIILINDKDGDLAEENLSAKIGGKYHLEKVSETRTDLVRR